MDDYEVKVFWNMDSLLVVLNFCDFCSIFIHLLICPFMFRDGVSESQFKQVLDIEINQIIKVSATLPFVVQFDYLIGCCNP